MRKGSSLTDWTLKTAYPRRLKGYWRITEPAKSLSEALEKALSLSDPRQAHYPLTLTTTTGGQVRFGQLILRTVSTDTNVDMSFRHISRRQVIVVSRCSRCALLMLVDALQYLWANASYNRPKKQLCAVLMIFLIQTMIAACRSDPIVRPPSCVAPKDWFPKTPPPTNAQPDPNSDCDFYKWAWQSFLSVTQGDSPGNAKPRFLEFQVPFELFVSRVGKRVEKTTKVDLPVNPDSVIQAGSQGLLVDQNGRAIYYQTHLNSVFVRFVRDGGYTESTKLRSAPASLEFPKGSLELKSSWKIVAPGEDASKFFTTAAIIPLLGLRNGQVFIDPAKTREETLALLGLHVVGVVQGHPEFIWATFEHNDNAPDLPPDLDPRGQEPVNSQRNWILYPKGTRARDCNKKPRESPLSPLKFADEDRQVLQPKVAVFRQFPFGGDD